MKKSKLIAILMAAAMVSTAILSGCGSKADAVSDADKDYTVKLGYYKCDHMTAAVIAKDTGIFDKLGVKVQVTGNGNVPTAMAGGQMDVGYIGTANLLGSSLKGAPIVIAANNHLGGSYYLVVSNNIKTPQDLLGKTLAIGTKPETDSCWVQMAKDLNIPAEGKNYKAVDMDSDQNKYLALKTGKIDGYTCCDPWGSMAVYEKTGKIMTTFTKVEGSWGSDCVLSMNKNFIKDHPALAKKMILAHSQAMEYIYTHPLKAAQIFAKNYDVPEEVALMTIYNKTVAEGRTLTWAITPDYIKHEIDYEVRMKALDKAPKYEDVVDDSMLKEAGTDDFDTFIKDKVDPVFPLGMSYADWKAKAAEIDK